MNFFESIKLSIGNLLSYKIRSFLTMLGIVIGIGAVVMMSSLGTGVKNNIMGDLNKMGVGNFEISIDTSPGQSYTTEDMLTSKDIEAIKELPTIEAVSPTSSAFARINLDNGKSTMFIGTGVTEDYFKIINYTIVRGRKFLPNEYTKNGKFIIIDSTAAEMLFPNENPIGQKLSLNFRQNRQEVTIVGVFKDSTASLSIGEQRRRPVQGLLPNQYLNFINGNEDDKFTSLEVKADDANSLSYAMAVTSNYLEKRGSDPDIYSVTSTSESIEQFNNILNMITLFISGVAAISLFVGGIGVMNIMLVSVTERVREVGLRKAIGAKNKDILLQFLIEAVILTVFGGFIGVLVGYSIALLIGVFINITPILSPLVVLVCMLVSSLTGLVFGVYPANKAAKLDPMVCLRTE